MSSKRTELFTIGKRRLAPALLFCLLACSTQSDRVHQAAGQVMGTTWSLKFNVPQGKDPAALEKGVAERLELVNTHMSNWQAESDVSRFGRQGADDPLTISQHTAKVLKCALEVAEKTGGVFDPTLTPLIDLWGFGAAEKQDFPSQEAIDAALAKIGYQHLKLEGNQLSKALPELTLSMNANAKGYAIDLASEYLQSEGVERFMMEVGGEVRTRIPADGTRPWRIGINDPANPNASLAHIASLENKALATSGDYHNFFMENGVRYSHIIHPLTGRPIPARVASVSIITGDCMRADAWATALMLLDPEKSLPLVESMTDMECLIMVRETDGSFTEVRSSGMSGYLVE